MNKLIQIIVNVALYAFLLFLTYEYTIKEWDPWNAFVVIFVLVISLVIWFIPRTHADGVHPGEYPYDD